MYNMNDYEIDYVDGSRDSQLLLYQNYLYTKHGKYYMCRNKDCKLLVKLTVSDGEVLVEPRDTKNIQNVQHIQGVDQSVSLQIIAYRKNPVDYGSRWDKSKAQRESEEKFIKLKVAYIAKSLELYDYMQ